MLRPRLPIPVFALCFAVLLACGGCAGREDTQKEFGAANAQWDSGDKVGAVRKYKTLYANRWTTASEKELILARIVDLVLKDGDTNEARMWINRGLDDRVNAEYSAPGAKDMLVAIRREREEESKRKEGERVAELKRQETEREADAQRRREERESEAKRKDAERQEEIKRRTEVWRAELEEKADELAKEGDAKEARLAEREATYKRRVEMGALDYSTKQEIEKLKKEIPPIWEALAKLEDRIAAGPPESVLAGEKPPAKEPVSPSNSQVGGSTSSGGGPAPVIKPPSSSVTVGGASSAPPKTVHVSGYTRKDGTYVKPHTRSSPKR